MRQPQYRASQPGIHNQIDYIAVPKRQLRLFTDARTYVPHLFKHRSNHSMLIASVQLGVIYKLQPASGRKPQERDVSILATSDDHRRAYQQRIEECIILEDIADDTEAEAEAETRYEKLKTAIRTAAEDTLPRAPKRING